MKPNLDPTSWFLIGLCFWVFVFAVKVYIDAEVGRAVRQEIHYIMRAAK